MGVTETGQLRALCFIRDNPANRRGMNLVSSRFAASILPHGKSHRTLVFTILELRDILVISLPSMHDSLHRSHNNLSTSSLGTFVGLISPSLQHLSSRHRATDCGDCPRDDGGVIPEQDATQSGDEGKKRDFLHAFFLTFSAPRHESGGNS